MRLYNRGKMNNFNNEAFTALANDLINDAFYVEGRSPRGKIATLRQYAELVVRKILDLSHADFVTLGNEKIKKKIKEVSNNSSFLLDSLAILQNFGNDCTHTQVIESIYDEDVKKNLDNLFNIISYLFIAHFEKYKFCTSPEILETFSLLPPIIRFKVLNELFINDRKNIALIDKLCLATFKAFDEEKASLWLEENKQNFESLSSYTEEFVKECEEKYGPEVTNQILKAAPKNMYVLCKDKINVLSTNMGNNRAYLDFESALPFYQKNGKLDESKEENREFNSIMEFVYLGRNKKNDHNSERSDLNPISFVSFI